MLSCHKFFRNTRMEEFGQSSWSYSLWRHLDLSSMTLCFTYACTMCEPPDSHSLYASLKCFMSGGGDSSKTDQLIKAELHHCSLTSSLLLLGCDIINAYKKNTELAVWWCNAPFVISTTKLDLATSSNCRRAFVHIKRSLKTKPHSYFS